MRRTRETLGATDVEIHDTILMAAAFCMYNPYVDGLATVQPRDEAMERERGKMVARDDYVSVSKTYFRLSRKYAEGALWRISHFLKD